MESNSAPDLKTSGLTEQEAKEAGVVGVDAKNRKHRFHTGTATVIVTRDDEVVHTEELAREHVPQWIDYVTGKCGWDQVWWSTEKLSDQMVQSLDAYQTGDELVCDGGRE